MHKHHFESKHVNTIVHPLLGSKYYCARELCFEESNYHDLSTPVSDLNQKKDVTPEIAR